MLRLIESAAAMRAATLEFRAAGKKIGVVPTMGALHAGHLSLVEASRRECDITVVTIFVNPTQFGPHEDFRRYPRTLEADLAQLRPLGVDVVFTPPFEEMYPAGSTTLVEVGGVALPLEGAFRPGHFRGVATIVLKLFNIIPADVAYFGQKDYQQTMVVKRMVADLDVPIRIEVRPIVREADGLAMSSRNVYLTPPQREQALVLSRSLRHAADRVAAGERRADVILAEMHAMFKQAGVERIDYIAIVDPDTLQAVSEVADNTIALIAAHVGTTRLIDNMRLARVS